MSKGWLRFPTVRSFLEGERAYLGQGIGAHCGGEHCEQAIAYRTTHQIHNHDRGPHHVRQSLCVACARKWVGMVNVETAKNDPDLDPKLEGLPPLEYDDRQERLFK